MCSKLRLHSNQRTTVTAALAALVAWPLLAGSVVNADFGDCHGASPIVNKQGFRPHATVTFRMAASPDGTPFPSDRVRCVERAFDAWTQANRLSGLRVRFVPGTGGIVVRLDNASGLALRGKTAGAWSDAVRAPDGYLERALIWLSANPKTVDTCEGVTKVILHELGHLHGLADNGPFRGRSVMNRVARKNDQGGWIPLGPTTCDGYQARAASRVDGWITSGPGEPRVVAANAGSQ